MGVRGRKSKAELTVASAGGVRVMERAPPPSDLGSEEKAEWIAVVNAYDSDRFDRGKWPVLADHCRLVVAQREVARLIETTKESDDFKMMDYMRLRKLQCEQSRALTSIGVRLGFAYSTAYEKRPPKGGKSARKPWEVEG